jgi:flagellar hook-length control protein FliK
MQSGPSAIGGIQVQIKPINTVPFSAINQTDAVPQVEVLAESIAVLSNRTPAAGDNAAFSRLGPALREVRVTQSLPVASGDAGKPVELQIDVVFTDPSAKGGASEGNEQSGYGAKENDKQGTPGPGIPAARTIDQPDSNRFALQHKSEVPINAIHESILTQVRTSVVSHDGKGNGTITVRLNPVELGELQVNLRIENQQVKVEIITDNRTVRDALMGNLDHLKETLLKQNLTMERFDVSSGGGNGFSQGFREDRGDQRRISTLPFGHDAAPFEKVRENGQDDWGVTDNSLVNLRL